MTKVSTYWKNKWQGRKIEPPNTFAKRALPIIKKHHLKNVLDVGCGAGRDSLYFNKNGLKVTATDFSDSGIAILQKSDASITTIQGDIRNIKLKPNSFDCIYAHLSLHYFDDSGTLKLFNKLRKVLRPKGLIFIKCKSTDDEMFGLGEKVGTNMYKKGHMRHFFTKEFMAKNLQNYKIISIKKTASVYHGYKSNFIEGIASK